MPDRYDADITASHMHPSSGSSSAAVRAALDNRFAPGTVLQDRYRIVAMLGKGGMGEVYRADDLKLGSSVALKLLPETLALDPMRLDRFRSEVRLTRQISHSNVCRVYDIGEFSTPTGTAVFLSMEYVDGEDLGSLLRRIGRLPEDKALQIARQICAGLHAAHEQGVIHRDLKPANIMLDGRGNARIMDFGVAGFVDELIARGDIASGTPAYMAPEQFNRTEVSRKSDLYSLGLVLYELFTGKQAFQFQSLEQLRTLHNSGTSSSQVTSPSEHVRGLDPGVERVILHCLESDPRQRPASALAVSAALPGGDPLAAALAAGETPSPELLAVSGGEGSIPAWRAWTLAGVVLAALLVIGGLQDRFGIHRIAPAENPPVVLMAKAREYLTNLAGIKPGSHEAYGVSIVEDVVRNPSRVGGMERLGEPHPASIFLWYRSEPQPFVIQSWTQNWVTATAPSRDRPGSLFVAVASTGHLLRFERVAPDTGFAATTPEGDGAGSVDWMAFIEAAGLDRKSLVEAEPTRVSQVPSDQRVAWLARFPTRDDLRYRVEAASLEGVPVSFRIVPEKRPEGLSFEQARTNAAMTVDTLISLFMLVGIGVSVYLALRNLKTGRSDRRGALTTGLITGVSMYLSLVLGRHTIGDMVTFDAMGRPFARALWIGGLSWLIYLGMEPSIRRIWPHLLISWSRLMSGRWRDALVWRDVLIGSACGAMIAPVYLLGQIFDVAAIFRGEAPVISTPLLPSPGWFVGLPFAAASLCGMIAGNFAIPLLITLALFGIHKVVRYKPISYVLTTIFLALIVGGMSPVMGIRVGGVALAIVSMILLLRVGQLAFATCLFIGTILINVPITLDLGSWYAFVTVMSAVPVAALVIAGARFAGRGVAPPGAALN